MAVKILQNLMVLASFKPSGAETRMFQENEFHNWVADALAPCKNNY